MLGQETRDLGSMIVQQGYKSSFMILYGHSRLDRPNEKFCWVYVRLPTHPPSWFENVWLCRFESYIPNVLRYSTIFCLYMIFDWLSVSFR